MNRRAAAWVWKAEAWAVHGGGTIARALHFDIRTLFIGLCIKDVRIGGSGHLRRFIRSARAAGIGVLAVEGDPDMLRGTGQANALRRAEAIARYQFESSASDRLDGAQYDIEPYTRDGFDIACDASRDAWVDTAGLLHDRIGAKLDHVLPFWLAADASGADLIERLAPLASGLTVMAYRTQRQAIVDCAPPMLKLAADLGLPVRVALECGSTAEPDRAGGPVYVSSTTNKAFAASHRPEQPRSTLISSTALRTETDLVSFKGDTAAMFAIADAIQDDLAIWPSFGGLAFHGLF